MRPKPKVIPQKRMTREQARAEAAALTVRTWLFSKYHDDPVGFARDVLKLRLWRRQRQILEAIARKKKVAVTSGQKTGKSTVFVVAALWWACTRPRGRVLLTGPSNQVVRDVLWKELRRIVHLEGPDGKLLSGPDVLGAAPAVLPSTGMQWPDGREIIGKASDTPESTQGFSGPEILIIIDEAAGVADPIFEALDGNTAAGGHIAAASNPTRQTGFFFDAFHTKREHWEPIEISSEESPNVTGEEDRIDGLAEPAFIKQRRAEYGVDSAWYTIRILGKFAGTASDAVVGLEAIEASRLRAQQRTEAPEGRLELGVDVARFGDDESAIAPRRGQVVFGLEVVHGFDTIQVAGKVIEVVRALRRLPDEAAIVKIDTSGGYGGGVADLLRTEHAREVVVVEVNASERADAPDEYVNRRAQLHFAVADWLKDGGELPADRKLEAELLTPTYSLDSRGRRKIESKDEIKKRLKRSPDRADAVALAIVSFKAAKPARVTGSGTRWGDDDARGFG